MDSRTVNVYLRFSAIYTILCSDGWHSALRALRALRGLTVVGKDGEVWGR